ncbi:DEAD/DEAH box helicase [Candidatus Formimonas warabiya]|uniref:ATP-dependent RNA helicase CshA n=1 Tax=Formimonas warabiya TaxID=1761012 RepID=A0A3G1KUF6_FORW1|nr:DEAD/DEAH box helicase [Candidatus Formimonas warabiya]ATW26054.1 DEAD/DEAH box helicase [Candidatus Formimonas warabiya]
MPTFYDMGLSDPIIRATLNMGFEEPTPIQEQTIPFALKGTDVIGQAQTGTGKTAAFGIPLVEKMDVDVEVVQGLIVAPTRELAIQVAEELNKIGRFKHIRALPIYGGQDINYQIRALRNRPQIIVGTPGRLMDHMRRKTIRLQHVTMVIIDEADEMLNMGFIEDIENILREVPEQRQTLLFSATMPKPIQNLAQQFMHHPEFISIKNKEVTVPDTAQNYIEVQERQKFDVLCRLLDIQTPDLAIIFGRTKRRVDELCEALNTRGYSVEGLHGDLNQSKRDSVLKHFREGTTQILVATDVAARGLDIPGVTHIYNFDIPQDTEGYVHRIGRTGRAGKTGLAVTFVTPRELGQLKLIEQAIRKKIDRKPVPTLIEAIEGQQRLTVERLMKVVEEEDTLPYRELAEELLEENDSVSLLSAALKLLTKQPNVTPVNITEEAPLKTRKSRNIMARQQEYRKWDGERGFNKARRNRPKPAQKVNKY